MSNQSSGNYILGYTAENKKFRPSDWVERLASVYATFDPQHRLCYHPMIKPVFHQDGRCLFIDERLSAFDPVAYQFIMDFAHSNALQIKPEGESEIKLHEVA